MSQSQRDIVIAGGGLVGASLACALAPLGYSVTVIEAVAPRATEQPSYDDRTLALGAASCEILRGLGLWQGLADSATAIRQVIVSELDRPGRVVLDAAEAGREWFGHVVEARAFGRAAQERLAKLEEIEVLCPARLQAFEQEAESLRLRVHGEERGEFELTASLLVAADGADSAVRKQLRIPARAKDYGQTAVICNVTPEAPHNGRAFERMTPTGPFAILPHVGERCGLVWCLPHDDASDLLELDDAEFLCRAEARSGGELGRFVKIGRRSAYPLRLVTPERDTDHRVAIIGNAAHAIHPVGAQGFNLGLRDVAVLAELLADADGPNRDPGAEELLAAYAAWRTTDREETVAWTDGMVGLFASPLALARGVRSAALLAHAASPALRRRLASRAMGYRGRVPRLALGQPLAADWEDA